MPTIGVLNVSPLSFDQNNPFLTGLGKGQDIASNFQNQQLLRQQILDAQYKNQQNAAQSQYYQPTAYADLLQAQAKPGLTRAQTNQANAVAQQQGTQAALGQAKLPYVGQEELADLKQKQIANQIAAGTAPSAIKKAAVDVYPSDSVAGRANQLKIASMDPQIANMLRASGVNIPAYADNRVQNASPMGTPFNTGAQMAQQATQQAQQLPMTPQQVGNINQRLNTDPRIASAGAPNQLPVPSGFNPMSPKLGGGTDPLQNILSGGNLYSPQAQAQMKATGETEGKNYANNWNDTINNAAKAAQEAKDAQYSIDQFKSNYDKTWAKGILGKVPYVAADAAGQEADKAVATLQQKIAGMNNTGHITNYEEQRALVSIPSRETKQEAVNDITKFMTAKTNQISESQKFFNLAKQRGLDPQQSQSLWQSYMEQRPIYDFENHMSPKYNDDWHTYLKPEAINSIMSTGNYVNIPKFNSPEQLDNWQRKLPANISNYVDSVKATAQKYGHSIEQVQHELLSRQGGQ